MERGGERPQEAEAAWAVLKGTAAGVARLLTWCELGAEGRAALLRWGGCEAAPTALPGSPRFTSGSCSQRARCRTPLETSLVP